MDGVPICTDIMNGAAFSPCTSQPKVSIIKRQLLIALDLETQCEHSDYEGAEKAAGADLAHNVAGCDPADLIPTETCLPVESNDAIRFGSKAVAGDRSVPRQSMKMVCDFLTRPAGCSPPFSSVWRNQFKSILCRL